MWPTVLRSGLDQVRTQAASPLSLAAALAMPFVFAFIVHSYTGGRTDPTLAVGIAGVGMLNAVVVDQLISLASEKQWKTLPAALGSPVGLVPVVFGRLAGVAVQSLISLPGTLLILGLVWGLEPDFAWLTWLIGGVCLAITLSAVVGLLAYFLLRFPFSPGMTNGLSGILIALGALLVPSSALPYVLRPLSWLMPSAHVMAWVDGAGISRLVLALAQAALIYAVIYLALRRIEQLAREQATLLEL